MSTTAPVLSRSDRQAPHGHQHRRTLAGWRILFLGAVAITAAGALVASGLLDPYLETAVASAPMRMSLGLGLTALGLLTGLVATIAMIRPKRQPQPVLREEPLPEPDSDEERALRAQILTDLSAITRKEREIPAMPQDTDWASLVKPAANSPTEAPPLSLGPASREASSPGMVVNLAWPSVSAEDGPDHVRTAPRNSRD